MKYRRCVRPTLLIGLGCAVLSTAGCGAPLALAGASYAADGALLAASSKTASDHLMSIVSKSDCALWRVFQGRPICRMRDGDKDPYDVDYSHAERTLAEDGIHYVPPLRPPPGTPATSWDAGAYDAAPAPESVRAVPETFPPSKGQQGPLVTTPSRGRAASAS